MGKGGGRGSTIIRNPDKNLEIGRKAIGLFDELAPQQELAALNIPGLSLPGFTLGDKIDTNQFEDALFGTSQDILGGAAPIRSNLEKLLTDVSTGDFDATQNPIFRNLFSTAKRGIEDQFGVAREEILSSLPVGGVLQGSLADLSGAKAVQLGAVPGQISSDLFQNLLGEAFGFSRDAVTQALTGFGTAGATFGTRQGQSIAATSADTQSRIRAAVDARNQDILRQLEQRKQDLDAAAARDNLVANLINTNVGGVFGLQSQNIADSNAAKRAKGSGTGQLVGTLGAAGIAAAA